MSSAALQTAGLSGDLGWNEAEAGGGLLGGLGTGVLVLATGAVWGAVWLLSGLPPLLCVAHLWRNKQA